MKYTFLSLIMISLIMVHCTHPEEGPVLKVSSPSGINSIEIFTSENGRPLYRVLHRGAVVIDTSGLGFDFLDMPPLREGLRITGSQLADFNEDWEMPWGEQRKVLNTYRELRVDLKEEGATARILKLYFRAYDDGIAFRYEFPEQENMQTALITEENTEFRLSGDHLCWWQPGDWDIYEHLYNTSSFTAIDAIAKRHHPSLAQTYIPHNAVNTPVTMKTGDGLYLSIHEAALTDYAGMTLLINKEELMLQSCLVGSENTDYKAERTLPFVTPWRSIQIADRATDLINSRLILNLNESNRLGNVEWFSPMKYAGIWWEMHLDKSTWAFEGGRHGATTAKAMELIDFAATNNIGGVLVEGWNTGWERWIGFEDREGVFDFVTPYPDYDLPKVAAYAAEKGVELIMHHETSSAVRTYEQQLDTAFKLMQRLGLHTVKTGYVGKIIPAGEYHHGQYMVRHYRRVIEAAAKHNIAVNAHEPIKPTGLRRTFPNEISREGLRGQEFNAWSADGGNPPEHLSIVAFTRMLAGPIDYTPGIFNIKLKPYKENNQVNTTLAHQLALYVVIYSPVQMVPDLIENYTGHPAFEFIRQVGVDWEQSLALDGEPGDFVCIARQERESGNWFVGGITDENERSYGLSFDFLDEGSSYQATLYADGPEAHWDRRPEDYYIEDFLVRRQDVRTIRMAAGGGFAISLVKILD